METPIIKYIHPLLREILSSSLVKSICCLGKLASALQPQDNTTLKNLLDRHFIYLDDLFRFI